MSENVNFKKGSKKREELQLPILHFVAADDWIDKLGTTAFVAWLKFYSWCDRSDARLDKDNDVIPTSFEKLYKRLGIGKGTFYQKVLRPLWNYGLIDIEEYKNSEIKGQKPMNIIVYEYPQNDRERLFTPLEKIRDYDKDYSSDARTFAKRKTQKTDRTIPVQGAVPDLNRGPYQSGTGDCTNPVHNNVSNSINNVSNDINNVSNVCVTPEEQRILDLIDSRKDLHTHKEEIIRILNAKKNDETFKHDVFEKTLEIIDVDVKGINYLTTALSNNLRKGYVADYNGPKKVGVLPHWFNKSQEQKKRTAEEQAEFEKRQAAVKKRLKKQEPAVDFEAERQKILQKLKG